MLLKTKSGVVHAVLGICLGLGAVAAQAQVQDDSGYWRDARGEYARSGHGLCWRSGYWTPGMAVAECDPDLVKKAEAPKPVLLAEAPKPAPGNCDFAYSLQNDETFAFDKAELNAAAKAGIDGQVIARLPSCSAVKVVLVTGHTDRLGSEAYNEKLSMQRAEAVKSYLVGKGVKAESIETAGKGESAPIKDCDAKLKRKALIACLGPNRRTVIEVRGAAK
ncbi:MAG: OmpA family protein [Betaproteobacteria bacterium]|nr:OmpA family protein [Betaproteobacteria bacterium]